MLTAGLETTLDTWRQFEKSTAHADNSIHNSQRQNQKHAQRVSFSVPVVSIAHTAHLQLPVQLRRDANTILHR